MNPSHLPDTISFEYYITENDINSIREILDSSGFFYTYEVDVAVEIAEEYLSQKDHNGYFFVGAYVENKLIGFTTYGLIPCTKDSYDLYWIAVHNDFRGRGIGIQLLDVSEQHIKEMEGKRVYIETSSTEKYAPTQNFYYRGKYILEASLKNYYRDGDDKLIFSKTL